MPDPRHHFEHFEIETNDDGSFVKLGRGGMGTTYKAFDTRRKKHVALKKIDDKLLADQTSRRRFFNEARAASNLDHPNVVRVDYVCSEEALECFYAMEWVDGESLGQRVKNSGALPPREALLLLRAVADALTVLGEQRLVHRDIKPDNIMIARAGRAGSRVKLIDFGLAKALENAADRFTSVDTGGHFVGSVYFSSPEQIRTREELDCRSDFYSLGATLWWVLTVSPVFTGTAFEVQKGHVEDEPSWEKIALLPACIQTLLRRLLAKDPAQRPPDAEALLTEWDAALANLEPASPQRARDDVENDGGSQPHADSSSASSVVAIIVDQAPPGCDAPPSHASLARDAASGEWLAVRAVPLALAPETRAELSEAARAAQAARASGLLNVCDVRDEEVVSEWPPSVAATRVLAAQQGALPLAVILAWLPKLATTIDWACAHGLSRLGLDPARWQVAFEMLAENETPSERAACAPAAWGPHYVFLDPLAGFDAELAAAAAAQENTVVPPSATSLDTPAEYLAALARALHELLGGRDRRRLSPLPALGEASNELLFAALLREAEFGTVSEWAAAFVSSALSVHEPPRVRNFDPASPPQKSWARTKTPWAVVAVLVTGIVLVGAWRMRHPDPIEADLTDAIAALKAHNFALVGEKIAAAEKHSPGDERTTKVQKALQEQKVAELLAEASAAVAAHNFSLAEEKVGQAEALAPGDLRIAKLRSEIEKETQQVAIESKRKEEEQRHQIDLTLQDERIPQIELFQQARKAASDFAEKDAEAKKQLILKIEKLRERNKIPPIELSPIKKVSPMDFVPK